MAYQQHSKLVVIVIQPLSPAHVVPLRSLDCLCLWPSPWHLLSRELKSFFFFFFFFIPGVEHSLLTLLPPGSCVWRGPCWKGEGLSRRKIVFPPESWESYFRRPEMTSVLTEPLSICVLAAYEYQPRRPLSASLSHTHAYTVGFTNPLLLVDCHYQEHWWHLERYCEANHQFPGF